MTDIVIRADNIGLRFRLRLEKRPTFKKLLTGAMRRHSRNEFWALREVTFSVRRGETLGVIGPNGSGKSTLLRIISGIYRPNEGYIETRGRVSTLLSLTAGFQPELSGVDNIFLVGMLMGLPYSKIKAHLDEIIQFAAIGKFIDAPTKTYSSGMAARLGFAVAAHLECDILLVDEILGVGDREFRLKSQAKIRELLDEQRTVVLVSHNLAALQEFATTCLWLDQGRVRGYGPANEVIAAYQGALVQSRGAM